MFEGNVCDRCRCNSAAIAYSALATYATRFDERRVSCPATGDDVACEPCARFVATCEDGTCAAVAAPSDPDAGDAEAPDSGP